jgi:5-methylcytosine-specific restriction endonuclease McrA
MAKWRRNKSNTRRWQRNQLVEKQSGLCAICGLKFDSMKDITFDHIIPISKGGDDLFENFQLAHYHCNQLKNDMTPEEFREFQQGGVLVE